MANGDDVSPRRHGGMGGPRYENTTLGKVLPADKEAVYGPPDSDDAEPEMDIQKYPDDFSPGIIVGYSRGLWGKGIRKQPLPHTEVYAGDEQWGDPADEAGWYR